MKKWEYRRYEFRATNQLKSWYELHKLTENGWRIKFVDPYLVNFILERRVSHLRRFKTYIKDRFEEEKP